MWDKHYKRRLNKHRIVNRIKGLRSYCSFSSRSDLIDDDTSNHLDSNSQSYADCQLLQLTDLLIGCFRTVLGKQTRPINKTLAVPIEALIIKYFKGQTRMKNSSWRDSFCLSQCYLDGDNWVFEAIENKTNHKEQLRLPF